MSLPSVDPTTTDAWKKLETHYNTLKDAHMSDLFSEDNMRSERFSLSLEDFYVDFSKNRITEETINLLISLAEEVGLEQAIDLQFSGAVINETQGRAVLHTALRDFDTMKPEVRETLQKMKELSQNVISGQWTGFTGKKITHVVNVGIGGSELGPKMAIEALQHYKNHLTVRFVSNVDGDHLAETLKDLNPETTLFLIVSKSFSTQETLMNAHTIRKWFLENASEADISKHFVAVSTNLSAVSDFGIASENVFPMWDWVGGRFSLWSAVGLSICCAVGYEHFEEMLKGASDMDAHFRETEFRKNIPVILGLLSVWYNNFFEAESEAVIPYAQYLDKLVPYLQQAVMESNGKSVDRNGNEITYQTGTLVWGSTGTNAQHAFFQLMHQGTKLIPADFIVFSEPLNGFKDHHEALVANCLAQTKALMEGTHNATAETPFREFKGNKPSNTLLIKKLTPRNLGRLIALYEHKLFVQGIIWNIFSYDQWGVELGKKLAGTILRSIHGEATSITNSSTRDLLKQMKLGPKNS